MHGASALDLSIIHFTAKPIALARINCQSCALTVTNSHIVTVFAGDSAKAVDKLIAFHIIEQTPKLAVDYDNYPSIAGIDKPAIEQFSAK